MLPTDTDGTARLDAGELVAAAVGSVPGPEPVVRGLAEAIVRRLPSEEQDSGVLNSRVARGLDVLSHRNPGELRVEIGRDAGRSVVDVTVEDAPLLLSTVLEEADRFGVGVRSVLHPVLGVRRDGHGKLIAVEAARTAEHREAWLHVRLAESLDEERSAELQERIVSVLESCLQVHDDLPAMKDGMRAAGADLRTQAEDKTDGAEVAQVAPGARDAHDAQEAADLIDWMLRDRLVILGAASDDHRLGLLVDDVPAVVPGAEDAVVRVGRTLHVSPVHRRERMVDVRLRTSHGPVRIIGLFSSQAYADAVTEIPLARRSLARILDAEDLVEGSHDERALRMLFASLPLDLQLGADPQELRRTIVPLLAAQREQDVTLRMRFDAAARIANVIVTLPRDRFTQRGRQRIQEALVDRMGGADADYHLSITREDWVLLHFVIHAPEGRMLDQPRVDDLQRHVVALTRTWRDSVSVLLRDEYGEHDGRRLADRWLHTFPGGYTDRVAPEMAVVDIDELDRMEKRGQRSAMRLSADDTGSWHARLYLRGDGMELSQIIPVMESLGLVVVDEIPYNVADWGHLHVLRLRAPAEFAAVTRHGRLAAEAALAVLNGRAEADDLNRLVLLAGIGWEDVAVLRAYRRYRRQVGTGFTESYQNAALCDHPAVSRALIDLFTASHDPRLADEDGAVDAARDALTQALDAVERLDMDRILRNYAGLVDATLRTNRYLEPRRGWLTLKFDSARVPDAGKPVPFVDTFVYAPSFEGIHLRGGPVARGGIRHSIRQEDVRSEVLGLMKAQMTKNAMIVPVGAKGGFVLKGPVGPDPTQDVRLGYEKFIQALLDVTDNIVDGQVQQPAGVQVLDADDPYLVVAPDRGTGTFSDIANEIALDRDFWLGDAFASGGSRGYDHKGMGITARGAWVAVRRHFAELGVDVSADPVKVIGIGDMSGDVFGNGMLQSRSLRLVAAFDHRDVFVDPNPDPEISYAERERLAALPRSSWQDYDRSLISKGGGVWSRTVKAIAMTDEMRELLRVDDDMLSPPELIQAILRAPADLLFAGGVGTFVKSADETHADVADRANDAIRVDAKELSVRVVGEGANLAMTQRARIQYSRRGGRCNTDAIDNAAGVATSDAEVNLKILLAAADDAGLLEAGERDRLLADAAEDVAARVLADVDAQTRAISRELVTSPGGLEAYGELMDDLEQRDRLDRDVEALPHTDEIARRHRAEAGLTRPELAVLLAYAKLDVRDALVTSDLVDCPGVRPLLLDYLPASFRERFGDLVVEHRLRRELVATRLASAVIDDMGITWARRAAEELGVDLPHIARAYWIARQVIGAGELWREVAALGSEVDHTAVEQVDETIRGVVDACARVYARRRSQGEATLEAIERDQPVAATLTACIDPADDPAAKIVAQRWKAAGVPVELADRVAALPAVAAAPDVASVSRVHGREPADVVGAFTAAAEHLPLRRLEEIIERTGLDGRWSRWQREGLVDELRRARLEAVTSAYVGDDEVSGAEAVTAWMAAREWRLSRVEQLVSAVEAEEPDLDGASVVVRALRDAVSD